MFTDHREFDANLHERFTRISCDINPIHTDATEARRTHAGCRIVHGIHALIWILDGFSRSDWAIPGAKVLKAKFLQPIYLGDRATLEIRKVALNSIQACVKIDLEEVVLASIEFGSGQVVTDSMPEVIGGLISPPDFPRDPSLAEMGGVTGCLSFTPFASELVELFPSAVRFFGIPRIAALVCSSCLVGMVVPGLHSLFLGLQVNLVDEDCAPRNALQFAVVSVLTRFRLVRIKIQGQGIRGTLETISRMRSVTQPSMDSILPLISRDEFQESISLIIGGSRGLGELTAKLVAAGGGKVVITYFKGQADSERVVQEINAAGLRCSAVPYNSLQPALQQLTASGVAPTHVYYFATPPISQRKSGLFDFKRFSEFNSFYITSFFELVLACLNARPEGVRIFFPTSAYIDARPPNMTEYTMSKAAAEVLCNDISRFITGAEVLTRRLPRLLTDQTNSPTQKVDADAIGVLLPIVREMNRSNWT
jgi:hypothetical protein